MQGCGGRRQLHIERSKTRWPDTTGEPALKGRKMNRTLGLFLNESPAVLFCHCLLLGAVCARPPLVDSALGHAA